MLIFRSLRAQNRFLWNYGKILFCTKLPVHRKSLTRYVIVTRKFCHTNDLKIPVESTNSLQNLLQGLGLDPEMKLENLNDLHIDGLLLEAMINDDRDALLYILQETNSKPHIPQPSRYCLERIMMNYIRDRPLLKICYESEQDWMEPYFVANNWYLGDFELAGQQFRELYAAGDENQKYTIYNLLRKITIETVNYKSEAQLVVIVSLAEYLVSFSNDNRLMLLLFRNSFKSPFEENQQVAKELYKNHPELRSYFHMRGTVLKYVNLLLKINESDAVHRLAKLYLEYDEKEWARLCLSNLFDFHHYRRNLKASADIVRFCIDNDISLTDEQEERFVDLLLESVPSRMTIEIEPGLKFSF
ncbi:uncharacterized protein LOC134835535 [Culicoides brevitarsis]|uniref:uncharacterized protein LOC134835535 n=1 Tax=Culicoides brevitarsis TaxID=469753 RepID=UPI00307B61D0